MLRGKTALITGASRGIGRGIAQKFADYGAFVGINYNSFEKGAKETLNLILQLLISSKRDFLSIYKHKGF